MLPFRGGPDPVPHAITTFTNVRLPSTALLGSFERPKDIHANLMSIISRVNVGTLALGSLALPFLQCYTTIGTLYSLRRVIGPAPGHTKRLPILSFRTQQGRLLAAAANAYVIQALQKWTVAQFSAADDSRVRAALAAIFKSVAVQHSQQSALAISERCGAQGLFAYNQITNLYVSDLCTYELYHRSILTLLRSRTQCGESQLRRVTFLRYPSVRTQYTLPFAIPYVWFRDHQRARPRTI